MRKLRFREEKTLAKDHVASELLSQDEDLKCWLGMLTRTVMILKEGVIEKLYEMGIGAVPSIPL